MNAAELKAKARERLAEIAKQRAALDAEEWEIRVMLGDVPPAPTVSPLRSGSGWCSRLRRCHTTAILSCLVILSRPAWAGGK